MKGHPATHLPELESCCFSRVRLFFFPWGMEGKAVSSCSQETEGAAPGFQGWIGGHREDGLEISARGPAGSPSPRAAPLLCFVSPRAPLRPCFTLQAAKQLY